MAAWGTVELTPREIEASAQRATLPTAMITAPPGVLAVRCIRFVGDVDAVATRGSLHSKVGAAVDAADVAADRALLEASLVVDGHLDAAVKAEGNVDIVFTIDAGPVYRIGAVRLVGVLAMKHPALAEELTVGAGDEVSARAIERTQERLATWLTVHGITRALVTHQLTVDRASKRVDVTYDAELRPAVARR